MATIVWPSPSTEISFGILQLKNASSIASVKVDDHVKLSAQVCLCLTDYELRRIVIRNIISVRLSKYRHTTSQMHFIVKPHVYGCDIRKYRSILMCRTTAVWAIFNQVLEAMVVVLIELMTSATNRSGRKIV